MVSRSCEFKRFSAERWWLEWYKKEIKALIVFDIFKSNKFSLKINKLTSKKIGSMILEINQEWISFLWRGNIEISFSKRET